MKLAYEGNRYVYDTIAAMERRFSMQPQSKMPFILRKAMKSIAQFPLPIASGRQVRAIVFLIHQQTQLINGLYRQPNYLALVADFRTISTGRWQLLHQRSLQNCNAITLSPPAWPHKRELLWVHSQILQSNQMQLLQNAKQGMTLVDLPSVKRNVLMFLAIAVARLHCWWHSSVPRKPMTTRVGWVVKN
jgi:hypothetical protein